ncbi:hypothetical protein HGB13_01640 [bacterium]|nr:hypothetical protein [bacterium]
MPLPRVSEETFEIVFAENKRPRWTDDVLSRLDNDNPILSNFLKQQLLDTDSDEMMVAIIVPALVFYETIRTEIANQELAQLFTSPTT